MYAAERDLSVFVEFRATLAHFESGTMDRRSYSSFRRQNKPHRNEQAVGSCEIEADSSSDLSRAKIARSYRLARATWIASHARPFKSGKLPSCLAPPQRIAAAMSLS
jgi:hypothetical protein